MELNGNVSSLAPGEAQKKYGRKAKDGVVVIEQGQILKDFETALARLLNLRWRPSVWGNADFGQSRSTGSQTRPTFCTWRV